MYKVGDMVRIRDLPVGPGNDPLNPGLWYNPEMKKMAGARIKSGRYLSLSLVYTNISYG